MYSAFGKFGGLAHQIHSHANPRAAFEIGPERDILFGGNAQGMIEQADRARRTDGSYDCGNRGRDRLNDDVSYAAANLPRLAFDPRSFVVNSAMKQAFKILKSLERRIDWNRDRNGILDTRAACETPH